MNKFARKNSKSKDPKQVAVPEESEEEEDEVFRKKSTRRGRGRASSKSSQEDVELVSGSKKRKNPLDAYNYRESEESTPQKRRKDSQDAYVASASKGLATRRSKLNKIEEEPSSKTPDHSAKKTEKASAGIDDMPDDLLDDKKFAVTGMFQQVTRDDIENFIKNKGGKLTGSVSGVTNFLVAGHQLEDGREVETSGKYKKAVANGEKTKILTEETFEAHIRELSGIKNFSFGTNEVYETLELAAAALSPEKKEQKEEGLVSHEMWTDTYKPTSLTHIVGNQGVIKSMLDWLKDWEDVCIRGNKKQLNNPGRFNRNAWVSMPNPNARAALISGPPGIGKTSAVRIICRQLGFEVLEMNASDVRSRTAVLGSLSTLSGNQSIDYFTAAGMQKKAASLTNPMVMAFGGHHKKKSVIIMDEVDGCGAGDRGGIAALIQMIKTSKTPIICICNDRQNRKLVSLVNHCYDLKFHRPTPDQIMSRLKSICGHEELKSDDNMLRKLIESSGSDLRQIINVLQMWKNQSVTLGKDFMSFMAKDEKVMMNNFDAASKLLNLGDVRNTTKYPTYRSKMDLFFIDHEFVPLLVQENYLNAQIQGVQKRDYTDPDQEMADLEAMALASDCISCSDVVSVRIRRDMVWSLLPDYGTLSSVAPSLVVKGCQSYPSFPQFLGKFSSQRKHKRLQRELKQALSMKQNCMSPDYYSVQAGLVPLILYEVMARFKKNDIDGLLDYLDDMSITNDMIKEHLLCLDLSGTFAEKFDKIEPKTKAAFTRAYNKEKGAFKRIGKGKAGTGGEPKPDESDAEKDASSDEDEYVMMDEDQIAEIKAAKKTEQDRAKAARTIKKLEKHQSKYAIDMDDGKASPKKGKGKAKTAPAKKSPEKKNKKEETKQQAAKPKKGKAKTKKAAEEKPQDDAGGGLSFF